MFEKKQAFILTLAKNPKIKIKPYIIVSDPQTSIDLYA